MIKFEPLLEHLQQEGLTLDQANQSTNPLVQNALTGKENQKSIDRFHRIRDYLHPYPLIQIEDLGATEACVRDLSASSLLGLDIETQKCKDHPQAGLNPKLSRIRLIQLFDGNTVYIFDVLKMGSLDWMKPLQHHPLIAHNATFEAQHFHHAGIVFSQLDCTMLEGRVFFNKNLSLKEAAQQAFDLEIDKTLQVSDWSRVELLPEQITYAALDAVIAYQLHQCYQDGFEQHPHYRDTYQFLRSLIYPLVRQQAHGIRIDQAEHQKIIDAWRVDIDTHRSTLEQDGLSNPKSTRQVQNYLKSQLSAEEQDLWPKTKTGGLATDRGTLEQYSQHPQLQVLAQFTTLSNRLANFGEKLRELSVDGLLYPSYQIAGMVSGRFGCTNPNIQNQPRNGFKQVYLAPEGCQFVTGDLAQVELRVAGLVSEDSVINQAYAEGQDLHRLMAAKMTGQPEDQITKAERTAAKGVNFGLLFGGGARGLQDYVKRSYGVEMTLTEAEAAKATFHATYPEFTEWQKLIVQHTNQHSESESTYCRLTRHYGFNDHYQRGHYKDMYTHAMNYPIQSSAWEILALTILYVDQNASEGIYISHHVYDELTLVAPDEKVQEAGRLLLNAFEHGYQTVFPGCNLNGIVEVSAGRNWAEAGLEQNQLNFK